jgi:hypothetical protein
MLGISADRLFGESLPVQTHYFAFAALILIAAMVTGLWFRSRNRGREADAVHPFTIHDSRFTIHYSPISPFPHCCSSSSVCGRQKPLPRSFPGVSNHS